MSAPEDLATAAGSREAVGQVTGQDAVAVVRPYPAPQTGWTAVLSRYRQRLRAQLVSRWVRTPAWGQALVVFAATRLMDFVILDRMARFQEPSLWTKPDPGYLGVISMWDSDWYRRIAENGYPSVLPRDSSGVVQQNEWAFYPLYPLIVRGLMTLTGFGFPVAASVVSLSAGAGCVVVMRSLVEGVAGRSLALWTVVLFCCYPAAVVLQLPYAESLSMLLVVSVLLALTRRRYAAAVPLLLLAGISRPVAVPLAMVVGVHAVRVAWVGRGDLRRARLPAVAATCVAACAAIALWPVTATLATGDRSAYTRTELAWRVSHQLTPLQPWWDVSRFVLGDTTGPIVVVVVLVCLGGWLAARRAVVIAGEQRAWVICYAGYLLLVLDPFTALARLLVPLFPLGTLLAAASSSPAYRRSVAVAFVAGQVVWVCWLWRFSPPADWPP